MDRTAFITGAEYVEIVGGVYSPSTIELNEASEVIKYFLRNPIAIWTSTDCPSLIKLATAYQLKYMLENNDNEYKGLSQSFNLGKFSESTGGSVGGEYSKIAPKSRRYCIESGYVCRILR